MRRLLIIVLVALAGAVGAQTLLSSMYSRINRGLVGWWKFDEGSGSTALDSSGYGNNGNWAGTKSCSGTYHTAGHVGPYAGCFDGSTNYVTVTSTPSIGSSGGTWSAWVNTTVTSEQTVILQTGTSTTRLSITNSSGGIIELYNAAIGARTSNSVTLQDGNWHLVTVTVSGGVVSFYADGAPAGTPSIGSSFSSTGVIIGQAYGSAAKFTGDIDEVRIYNRALSAAEVAQLYMVHN